MLKTILIICGLILSIALCAAGFMLSGSGQDNLFYTGVGFGMAAILIFSMTINSMIGGKKQLKKMTKE